MSRKLDTQQLLPRSGKSSKIPSNLGPVLGQVFQRVHPHDGNPVVRNTENSEILLQIYGALGPGDIVVHVWGTAPPMEMDSHNHEVRKVLADSLKNGAIHRAKKCQIFSTAGGHRRASAPVG